MNRHDTTEDTHRTSSIPRLYAPADVAQMLGVSLRTVRNWIRAGDLAHTRLTASRRLIRVREEDLADFLNRSYQTSQTTPGG